MANDPLVAGCTAPRLDSVPPAGDYIAPSSAGVSAATEDGNRVSGDNQAPQATIQTRGQFDLVGGQSHVINGFVRIPALVRNSSPEWADVVIDVELLAAADRPRVNRVATHTGEQMRSAYSVPPGGVMFYLYLRDVDRLNGQYAGHRLTLQQAYAADPAGTAQVTLTSQTARKPAFDGAPAYLARGTVTTAAGCAEPLVVAAGFTAAGNLLDVVESLVYPVPGVREFGTDLADLAPGVTGHFTLEFLVPGIQTIQAVAVCL